jgi:excisionase family DNA binding protein
MISLPAAALPAERLLLKPDEASAALSISPRLLWGLTKAGEIPAVRIGRAVRYDPADLRRWIEAQKTRGIEGRSAEPPGLADPS